jgi:hypothetical protein
MSDPVSGQERGWRFEQSLAFDVLSVTNSRVAGTSVLNSLDDRFLELERQQGGDWPTPLGRYMTFVPEAVMASVKL